MAELPHPIRRLMQESEHCRELSAEEIEDLFGHLNQGAPADVEDLEQRVLMLRCANEPSAKNIALFNATIHFRAKARGMRSIGRFRCKCGSVENHHIAVGDALHRECDDCGRDLGSVAELDQRFPLQPEFFPKRVGDAGE